MEKKYYSKKELLSLLEQKKLEEMPMDFDTPDRPDQGVQDKLRTGDTSFKKIPLPDTGDENKNFQELLASERYKQVIEKVRQYTGMNQPLSGMEGVMPLVMMMMNAHNQIVSIESNHKESLQNLAVELVKKEMNLSDDDIQFEAKIVGMGEVDTSDFNREAGNQENEEEVNVEVEVDLMNDLEKLNLEKAKRRFINSMIQGASKKGHYMYHMVADSVKEITGSEQIINLYGVLMSVNDTMYWQLSDEQIKQSMGGPGGEGGSVAGKESIDAKATPPIVRAEAINFPALVHELIKGVMEVLAVHGMPSDEETFDDVSDSEDTLDKESWDLRLGPAIWDRIRSQFPERIVNDEDKLKLQNFLLMNIFKLEAREFLILMKEVVSKSENGRRLLDELVSSIEQMLNNEDYEDAMYEFTNDLDVISDETDDDDLYGFLGDLGIDRPSDN